MANINAGLLLLVGFGRDDSVDSLQGAGLQGSGDSQAAGGLQKVAQRVLDLRVFADDRERMQYSARERQADILVVPQFTLYSRLDKGRRPDFGSAMAPGTAAELFQSFVDLLRCLHDGQVQQGQFGANMQVGLINDGPLTLLLEV